MKKIIKVLSVLFTVCIGLGVVVGTVERIRGKVGWVGNHKPKGIYEKYVKRVLDFGLSLFALIILSPIYLVTAFLIYFKLGSPILFKQERPGLGEKNFNIYKFRTMSDEQRDSSGNLLTDEQRLSRFGVILRSTSIDELPELINIIRGNMSIIGPRPLLPKYLPFYTECEHHRHDVRQGLTGYAQAHGRNTVDWGNKFSMDIEYANNITFKTDVKILFDTIMTVLKRDGIHSDTSVTMESFTDYARKRDGYYSGTFSQQLKNS